MDNICIFVSSVVVLYALWASSEMKSKDKEIENLKEENDKLKRIENEKNN